MTKLALSTITAALIFWVLVYSNDIIPLTGGAAGALLYLGSLVWPSLSFWFILASIKKGAAEHTLSIKIIHLFFWLSGLGLAVLLNQLSVRARTRSPGLFSAATSVYVFSGILALVFVASFPGIKRAIVSPSNTILGKLAGGSVIGLWALGITVHYGFRPVTGQSIVLPNVALYLLDTWFLLTLVGIFLCLLGKFWKHWLFGVTSLLGLLLFVLFSPGGEIALSLLTSAWFFWPLVTLTSLSVEALLFRMSALWLDGPTAASRGTPTRRSIN
jgi:hypothetical protein